MKKKSLHAIAKKHGYKSDEDFYKDFPTEDAYIKKYGMGGPLGGDPPTGEEDGKKGAKTQKEIDRENLIKSLGLPLPTAADSLELYNNAIDLKNYYYDKMGYVNTPTEYVKNEYKSRYKNFKLYPSIEDGASNYNEFKAQGKRFQG